MSQRVTEAELLARIERGERVESAEEMTEAYRDNLIHLMTMQADSELAGGYGYVPWIMKAPGVDEKHVVAQIVKDEHRHASVMYGLLADLGVDVEAHVRAHDEAFAMRIDASADIGTRLPSCSTQPFHAASPLLSRIFGSGSSKGSRTTALGAGAGCTAGAVPPA